MNRFEIYNNQKLTLSKTDLNLRPLFELFVIVLRQQKIEIFNAARSSTSGIIAEIKGQAAIWGGTAEKPVGVTLTYDKTTFALLDFKLSRPLNGLAALTFSGIHFKDPHDVLEVRIAQGNTSSRGIFHRSLAGTLQIPDDKSPVIEIPFVIKRLGDQYHLEAPFEAGKGPGLDNLFHLLGSETDLEHWLPKTLHPDKEELSLNSIVQVSNLSFRIDPKDPQKLTYISTRLSFGAEKSWPIIPGFGFLTVGALWALLDVHHPLESKYRFPQIQVGGTITIDNAHIDLTARWPDMAIQGEMRQGDKLAVAHLLAQMRLPTDALPSANKALSISSLGFLAEPEESKKSFSFHITIEEVWKIEHGGNTLFDIASLSLSLLYEEGDTIPLSGSFNGKFVIHNYDVFIFASVQGSGGYAFEGSTGPGQAIPVGEVIDDLWTKFSPRDEAGNELDPGPIKSAVESFTVQNLRASFDTSPSSKRFTFDCHGQFQTPDDSGEPQPDTEQVITLRIEFEKNAGGFIVKLYLLFNQRAFELDFAKEKDVRNFIGAYQKEGGDVLRIKRLAALISDEFAGPIPEDLSITIRDLLFAYAKKGTDPSRFLFGIDLSAELNLSNLPLVGKVLPQEATLSVDQLQLILSSGDMGGAEVAQLNGMLSGVQAQLPEPSAEKPDENGTDKEPLAIQKGLNVSVHLNFGYESKTLSMPTDPAAGGSSDPSLDPAIHHQNYSAPENAKWIVIQKQLGPLHFERVGLQYQDSNLNFLLDAALSAAGLTLSLQGLSLGMPLSNFNVNTFDPSSLEFNIGGIGIDYSNGGLEIGGSLLKNPSPPENVQFEFDGRAIVRTEALTLNALGSYAQMTNGQASLFISAVLDYPLGGPSFFFVDGLAASFGYHRLLKLPAIDQVKTFPLVASAIGSANSAATGSATDSTLGLHSANIATYFPPSVGDYFFGVGIKFNTFKLIDSFLLLTASFRHQLEIGLLGSSTMIFPTPVEGEELKTPLAEVIIDLSGNYQPDPGFIGIDIRIRREASYILSKDCHLHGGAAFYAWLKDDPQKGAQAGDFVLTIGGYHPHFKPPAYYPRVPRLGFNWKVSNEIIVKGDGYFALVPSAVMAGGSLDATYKSGRVKAWFNMDANFLISWKPYHYEAGMYVDVGASYDSFLGTVTIDAGADLDIWGPEFSGKADIHVSIISFTVQFGDQTARKPDPIAWSVFRNSFLPPGNDLLSATIGAGLIKAGKEESGGSLIDLGLVNPKNLVINIQSVIPFNNGEVPTGNIKYTGPDLNVGPCAIASIRSEFTLNLTGASKDQFVYKEIRKNVPAALWGQKLKPGAHDKKLVESCLMGYEITPRPPESPRHTQVVDKESLSFDLHRVRNAFAWAGFPDPAKVEGSEEDVRNALLGDGQLLQELGFDSAEEVASAPDFLGSGAPEVLFMY